MKLHRFFCALLAFFSMQAHAGAVDSYRFLHISIDALWYIFLFLLIFIFMPFVIMATLVWRSANKDEEDESSDVGGGA